MVKHLTFIFTSSRFRFYPGVRHFHMGYLVSTDDRNLEAFAQSLLRLKSGMVRTSPNFRASPVLIFGKIMRKVDVHVSPCAE